tara:strand:+ start:1392 stop:1601 length:210 start_codon:yes stop_codon:yes gene_type:complete
MSNQQVNKYKEAMERQELYHNTLRMSFLYEEINLIEKQIQPQDCGHLKTAVSVLRTQLKDLKESMFKDG